MNREKLLRSKEFWLVQIQNQLYGVIEKYMIKKKLNRTGLAEKLNVTKGYVTQVLKGDFDHKLSKLIDLSLACDKVPVITFLDLEEYIKNDADNKPHHLENRHLPKTIVYNTFITQNIYQVDQKISQKDKKLSF